MSVGVALEAEGSVAVELGDRVVTARVRRTQRGRTTRIRVGRDLPLEVIIPAGAGEELAAAALRTKASWVERKLDALDRARSEVVLLGLARTGTAWFFGEQLPMMPGPVRFAREAPGALVVPDRDELRRGAVERWYRRTARRELRRLLSEEADRLGYEVQGIAVRDQRTRWGSCSSRGHISLNWRLFLAPEAVARYVIVHELCHLETPNHSRAFWRSVGQACPGWRPHAEWLARHGDELRRFGAHLDTDSGV